MAHINVTPEEVLSKVLNEVSDEENDNIEDITFLASEDYKISKDHLNIA